MIRLQTRVLDIEGLYDCGCAGVSLEKEWDGYGVQGDSFITRKTRSREKGRRRSNKDTVMEFLFWCGDVGTVEIRMNMRATKRHSVVLL
jgi:hypothetical protein